MKYLAVVSCVFASVVAFIAVSGDASKENQSPNVGHAYSILVSKTNLWPGTELNAKNSEIVNYVTLPKSGAGYLECFPTEDFVTREPIEAGQPILERDIIHRHTLVSSQNYPEGKKVVAILVSGHGMDFVELNSLRGKNVLATAADRIGNQCLAVESQVFVLNSVSKDSESREDTILFGVWATEKESEAIVFAQKNDAKFSICKR